MEALADLEPDREHVCDGAAQDDPLKRLPPNKTALAMVFKLVEGAQKSWRRLDGHNQLPQIIQGVTFSDGLEIAAKLKAPQAKFAAA